MTDEEFKKIQAVVAKTSELVCDKFCKFSNTGKDGHCIWCQMNADKCPLDDLLSTVELR